MKQNYGTKLGLGYEDAKYIMEAKFNYLKGGASVVFDKMRKNVYFSILIIVPHVNICCSDKN